MAEKEVVYDANGGKTTAHPGFNDFVAYVERQASTMERFGWKEGHDLRKWAYELRSRSSQMRELEE